MVKVQIKATPWHCTLTLSNQCQYQVSTFYNLWFPWLARTKRWRSRSLQEGKRSNQVHSMKHEAVHLHPITDVPAKYQLSIFYSLPDIALTRSEWSRSLQEVKSPKTKGPYQVPTSYTSRFLRYKQGQLLPIAHVPDQTPCVKITLTQPLKAAG